MGGSGGGEGVDAADAYVVVVDVVWGSSGGSRLMNQSAITGLMRITWEYEGSGVVGDEVSEHQWAVFL